MTEFDIILLNFYVLGIFTVLIKAKTTMFIYRLFKLMSVALFSVMVYTFLYQNIYTLEVIVRFVPTFLVLMILVQTEFLLILKKLGLRKSSLFVQTMEDTIKIELIKSIDYLTGNKIGALISFEKTASLEEYIGNAYQIDAPLNSELLSTIFFPNTPLHDGAVIIKGNKIICAGAYYPPTERLDIPKQLGSRHRAAIGISEVTDALTIVVSEQSGALSVAVDGYLDLDISKESLLLYLEKHLQK